MSCSSLSSSMSTYLPSSFRHHPSYYTLPTLTCQNLNGLFDKSLVRNRGMTCIPLLVSDKEIEQNLFSQLIKKVLSSSKKWKTAASHFEDTPDNQLEMRISLLSSEQISEVRRIFKSWKNLALRFCDVNDRQCIALIHKLPWLKSVEISFCENLTDRAFASLLSLQDLQELKLQYCKQLSAKQLFALFSSSISIPKKIALLDLPLTPCLFPSFPENAKVRIRPLDEEAFTPNQISFFEAQHKNLRFEKRHPSCKGMKIQKEIDLNSLYVPFLRLQKIFSKDPFQVQVLIQKTAQELKELMGEEEINSFYRKELVNCQSNYARTLSPETWSEVEKLIQRTLNAESLPKILNPSARKRGGRYLGLSNVRLRSLPPVLSRFLALEVIDLSDNQLDTLPPSPFSSLKSLRILFLQNNCLSALPSDLLKGVINLRELYLDNNKLESCYLEELNCKKLEKISMQNNQLSDDKRFDDLLRQLDAFTSFITVDVRGNLKISHKSYFLDSKLKILTDCAPQPIPSLPSSPLSKNRSWSLSSLFKKCSPCETGYSRKEFLLQRSLTEKKTFSPPPQEFFVFDK